MTQTQHQWQGVEPTDPAARHQRALDLAKRAYFRQCSADGRAPKQSDLDLIERSLTGQAVKSGLEALRAAESALRQAQQAEQQAQAEQRDEDAHAVALDQMKNLVRRMF